jgi:hypothetical protein
MMDYDARCKSATTAQGLDPLIEVLTEQGVEFSLEQTGGFCMVVYIGGDAESPRVGVTHENGYLICGCMTWDDETVIAEGVEAKDVAALAAEWLEGKG